jgi:hypothetical protein
VRFDNATITSVTTVWLHYNPADGTDQRRKILFRSPGERILVQDAANPANFAMYTLTAVPADSGGSTYASMPVVYTGGGTTGGTITDGMAVIVGFVGPAASATAFAGLVELASNLETATGTDNQRAVTPLSGAATYALKTRALNTTAPLTGGGDLTADRTLDISTFTEAVKGAVPPPTTATGKFLKDDGTWATAGGTPAADSVDNTILANMPTLTIKGNNTGSTADPIDLTVAQSQTLLGVNPSGYAFHRYSYDTATTSPPSTGGVRLDSGTLSAITQIFISDTSADGGRVSAQHGTRAIGERLILQLTTGERVAYYRVTGTSATGTSTTVSVQFISSANTLPSNGGNLLIGYEGANTATESLQGVVELATAAETLTGTDNTRAVHPAGVAPLVSGAGQFFGFLFDTTTTAGTSTTGVRINNATPASATAIYVNYVPREGVDLKVRMLAATAGDRIFIQDRNSSANNRLYEVTGAPTDNTTYATIPVVHRSGAGSLWSNGVAVLAGFTQPPITIGTTAPSAPLTGDIWIDTT